MSGFMRCLLPISMSLFTSGFGGLLDLRLLRRFRRFSSLSLRRSRLSRRARDRDLGRKPSDLDLDRDEDSLGAGILSPGFRLIIPRRLALRIIERSSGGSSFSNLTGTGVGWGAGGDPTNIPGQARTKSVHLRNPCASRSNAG